MEDEKELLATILEVQKSLITVLDANGRIIKFNRACKELTGYSFEEVKGKKVWDLFIIEEEQQSVKDVFQNLRAKDFPLEYQNNWLTKEGNAKLISWSNSVILDNKDKVKVCNESLELAEEFREDLYKLW